MVRSHQVAALDVDDGSRVYSDRVSPLGAKAKAIVEKGSSDSEKKKRLYEEV